MKKREGKGIDGMEKGDRRKGRDKRKKRKQSIAQSLYKCSNFRNF